MASEVGQAYLTILPSARGFGSSLQRQVGGSVASTGTAMGKESSKRYRSAFLGGLKGMATGIGAFLALDKTVQFFSEAIEEAREAEKVGSRTANVIKSTGSAAGVTAKQVADLAEALSNKVGQDDEAIQSGANLLLTFKNIRDEQGKGNKIFSETTGLMVDMSTAMDQDMKSSAIQLGKALNDPTKGLSALSRVGVTFTEGQEKQIKHLQKTGDLMGAQKIILHELKSEFGGAGKAMADPADKAQVAWANLEEDVGTALMPALNRLATWFTEDGLPGIRRFAKKYGPDIKEFGGNLADAGKDIMPVAKQALPILADALGGTAKAIGAIAREFNKLPEGLQTAIITGALFGVGAKKFGLLKAGGAAAAGGAAVGGAAAGAGTAGVAGVGAEVATTATAFTRLTNSPLLRKAGWAGLALGTYDAAKQIKGLQTNTDRLNGSTKRIRQELEDSAVGDYAEDLGINLDRLAQSLAKYGSKGEYAREVSRKLTVSGENLGESFLREVVNPFKMTNDKVEQAGSAFRSLLPVIDRNINKQQAHSKAMTDARESGGNLVDLYNGALPKSMRLSQSEADQLKKDIQNIPDRATTRAEFLAAEASRTRDKFLSDTKGKFSDLGNETYAIMVNGQSGHGRIPEKGHADGGFVSGPGGPRDDKISARLSNGEFVVNADATRRNRELLESINAKKFADGGIVGRTNTKVNMNLSALRQVVAETLKALQTSVASGGMTSAQVARGLAFARSQVGDPYVWGGVGPNGYDCSGFQSAVFNAARGLNPYHRLGSTGTMPWPHMAPGKGGAYQIGWFTGNPGHTAGTLGGVNIESRGGEGVVVGRNARGADDPLFNRHAHFTTAAGRNIPVSMGRGDPAFTGATGSPNRLERWIIGRESGGRVTANNPSSSAFGLGQLISSNRVAYAKRLGLNWHREMGDTGTTDYGAQLAMMRMYMKDRYGGPRGAVNFWQQHGYYDQGGVLKPGFTMAYNGTGRDEYVTKEPPRRRGPQRIVLDAGSIGRLSGWIDDRIDGALDFEAGR